MPSKRTRCAAFGRLLLLAAVGTASGTTEAAAAPVRASTLALVPARVPALAAAPAVAPAPALQTAAAELAAHARALEKRGRLAEAKDAWFQAGLAEAPGAAREDCISRSRALDMRIALRRELREGYPRDTVVLKELGVLDVTEEGMRDTERVVPWLEVPLDRLQRSAIALRVSVQARAGLVLEALARGSAKEKDAALVELAKLVEKKELATNDAFPAIARARGELVPPSGYVFKNGKWSSVDQAAEAARLARIDALAKELETAPADRRDAAWTGLVELGADARARAVRALGTRAKRAIDQIEKSKALEQLAHLAEQRKELDARRKAALDLIFDEETYFYPYNPPECPPEKAKLYAGVQQRVDELVSRVRDVWKAEKRASVPANARAALEELAWNRARRTEPGEELALPASWPGWIEALDPTVEALDLSTFAWTPEERDALARDRAVLALNQRRWADATHVDDAKASTDEQHQVRITNEYRAMLGRRALAWDPRIQTAAQGHSDYMANTGDFGHVEPEPSRRGPGDRMRLAGYKQGVSENCAMRDGAEGAHVGWLHSSGHHRNILMATHTEMASGVAGTYWTQNFGQGEDFLADLTPEPGQ
jgi:uncharacterized protein YkwD